MKFYVLGIDDNRKQFFSPEIKEIIATHKVFSGGKRHHEIVNEMLPNEHQWIDITVPLDEVFKHYSQHEKIVVFASGDPLFFGFANTIQRELPEAELFVYPTFNSLQLLAHRLLLPYHDMHIVSLTGRPWHKLDEALIMGYDMIGILTDSKIHTPSAIAERLLMYGYDNYSLSVGELLGNEEEECVSTWRLDEVVGQTFTFPNNIILQKTSVRPRPFGIPDTDFHLLDGRAKMITKMPIRLLSLNMLDLREKQTMWDIGFCTGSVSIEAKLQFPHLNIQAFEIREEGEELMQSNMQRLGTPGIQIHIGDFMEKDISSLPRPDAVFIGGHGGKLKEIITKVCSVIRPQGAIVFNAVSDKSIDLFHSAIKNNQLRLEQEVAITIDNHNRINILKTIQK